MEQQHSSGEGRVRSECYRDQNNDGCDLPIDMPRFVVERMQDFVQNENTENKSPRSEKKHLERQQRLFKLRHKPHPGQNNQCEGAMERQTRIAQLRPKMLVGRHNRAEFILNKVQIHPKHKNEGIYQNTEKVWASHTNYMVVALGGGM